MGENRDFMLNGIYRKSIIVQEDNDVISIKSEHLNFPSRILVIFTESLLTIIFPSKAVYNNFTTN